MFVYRLTEPIDAFDGLTPLRHWLADASPERTRWALTALLALADTAPTIGWNGDMRHLPMIGGLPTRPQATAYLVVKQDNNGDTFIITEAEPSTWIGATAATAHIANRDIGAWEPHDDDFELPF